MKLSRQTLAMASTLCVTCFQAPQRAAAAPISPYCIRILDQNWGGEVRNAGSSWRSGSIRWQQQQRKEKKRRGGSWRVLCSENEVEEEVIPEEEVEFDITRLEKYTERVPNEVLRVHATVGGEEDQVIIFKGFSSSLMRPTAFDPAESVLPLTASIHAIDRLRGPFNPSKVRIIKGGRGLSWRQFQEVLASKGL